MTREQKLKQFRTMHERPGIFLIPNPWDAGSAKILTALGFEALATTSAGFSFSIGRQDSAIAVTRDEILENAKSIVDATHLPVSADLENGFGRAPEACAQTIRMAAGVGLAGGSIEDATGDPNDPIYDFELSVERVAAAAEAARQHGFVLTARAENFLHGRNDLADTIKRLQAFADAGADVVLRARVAESRSHSAGLRVGRKAGQRADGIERRDVFGRRNCRRPEPSASA